MLDEISAAVLFLVRLIEKSENFNQDQLQDFQKHLSALLMERFENHWFPDQPFKGQAYRCIRVNGTDRRDPTLERAAVACGLKYEDLNLPMELTLWVDPNEVCCRFGEHRGSFCTLASFNGKENASSDKAEKTEASNVESKSQVTPLSVSNRPAASNKSRKLQGRGSPKRTIGNKALGPWFNQGNLAAAGFPPSIPSWYTLIPRWLPSASPPCHHNPPLMRTPPVSKWAGHLHPNPYHWQTHKPALKV
ncbi:protein BTG1 [Anabrus simplex]|uniref:protein BTG1 n=1 Tax=Anabrus simplex TaxID=316456 RepID=UPI0034DD869B